MSYPPNFVPRSKPVSYTWLSWLLKLVVPVMVLPPLILTANDYLNLKELPSGAELYFQLIDEEVVEIGKAQNPYILDGSDNFDDLPEQINPSAQAEIYYAAYHLDDNVPLSAQSANSFEQWCYVSRRGDNPIFGKKTRGFLIDVDEFGIFDPEFGTANYSTGEYDALLREADCQPEPVKSQFNTILYLVRLCIAVAIGLLGAFAAFSFDHDNRNPLIEYGLIIFLATASLAMSMVAVYVVPLALALPIGGYLFWKRDVL